MGMGLDIFHHCQEYCVFYLVYTMKKTLKDEISQVVILIYKSCACIVCVRAQEGGLEGDPGCPVFVLH